jgi:hypothetical protein
MELAEASPEHKRAAVEAWLSCHTPVPIMREDLIYEGYLDRDAGGPVDTPR